ncbi:helix-turn-helix domain-containing protein [Dehalobacter sp. TBBPA1]|uniref:helix-turn-helix domain-containing protein n=1 Tax=Dehalobacter sp. TBBPA1 TaxID=3235037 RepID=UPI0034A146D2
MTKINIGKIIAARRKERRLTQEELAKYLGVSKPAVSKWESGQSYPDIMLLPVLAAFFNVSVDELLGYEAQMTKEDIRKLYRRLANAFAVQSFDQTYAECLAIIKKYHSCWNLVYSIAQLLVNHAPLAGGSDRMNDVLREASGYFECVEKNSCDAALAREALSLRAYCCLALQEPAQAIDLLEGTEEGPVSTGILLAKAYAIKGDSDRAKRYLQQFIYTNVASLFGAFPDLMALYADAPEKTDDCLQKVLSLGEVFQLKEMQPSHYFTVYLTAAALYSAQNRNEKALDMLEAYADIIFQKNTFPLKLKGNLFFDMLQPYFESLNLGGDAPRSDKLIRKDLKSVVVDNPAFQSLKSEERYQKLWRRLESMEEEA